MSIRGQPSDLVKALESVLQLQPQSDQARNDLAYLRLLGGNNDPEDLILAATLHQGSPCLFSFRITAALAQLHQKKPTAALTLLKFEPIPKERVRPGWQAVYAGVLSANGNVEKAKAVAAELSNHQIRQGERRFLPSD